MTHRERSVLKARALELTREGLSSARIAERLSLPPTTVSSWLRQEGIHPAPKERRDKASHKQILRRLRLKLAEQEAGQK